MSKTNGNSNGGPPDHRKRLQQAKDEADAARPATIVQSNQKERFLAALKVNGGNVSGALRTSGLKRNAAYDAFKIDTEFADAWIDALELATDGLFVEARRRATKGTLEPVFHNGKKCGSVRKFSDTLLIFLLRQGEAQKKWRNRIVQTGNMALESVRTAGSGLGLTEEQITGIQADMAVRFEKISLI